MRTTIALLFVLTLASSCTKTYCWKCAITDHVIVNNTTQQDYTTEKQVCDKSEKEIREYEQAGTYQKTSDAGNVRILTTTHCTQ